MYDLKMDKEAMLKLNEEIDILGTLKSENIIQLKAIEQTDVNVFQFYDYCNGGDLLKYVELK